MIKTFISHSSSDHAFVNWLKTKLERENLGLDVFVDDGTIFVGDHPQIMIEEVKRSIIFIPVLSNESVRKEFVINEIKTACESETTHVFPILFKCDRSNIPDEIKIAFETFDQVKGIIYEDFSNEKEWDVHYQNLRRAIFDKIVELGLLKEDTMDFYNDCEHLDLIIQRKEPTVLEIKTIIDIYLKKDSYARYFFSKLDNPKWLRYLKLYGFFKNNPQPIESEESPGYFEIPYWYVLDYFEKISQEITNNYEEIISDLLEIIALVSNFKDEQGKPIDNYHTWAYFVRILCNLPNEKIPVDIIKLIPIWLDSKFDTSLQGSEILTKLLPKFLTDSPEDIKKAEKIVYYATDVKLIPKHTEKFKKEVREEHKELFEKPEDELTEEEKLRKKMFDLEGKEYIPKIDTHWLIEAFINKKMAKKIGESCSKKLIDKLAKRLQKVLEREYPECKADLSYIWMPSLSDYPSFINKAEEILTIILRDIVLARSHKDEKTARKILKEFLEGEFKCPIFKRIALFVINKEWGKYDVIFWELIVANKKREFFEDKHYEIEVYQILEKHVKRFTPKQKDLIKEIIEDGPKLHLPAKDQERYINLWKQKWYSAMKSDREFEDLYNRCKKETKTKEYVATKAGRVQTRVGPGKSPLTVEQILSMSNNELAEFLSTFKTKDWWEGPTIEGLADALKDTARTKPEKFVADLSPFQNTAYIYLYYILWGIRDAWNEKKLFDWGKLLVFLKKYIDHEEFWKDKLPVVGDEWKPDHTWIIDSIGSLIQDGTRDDAWAFDEKYNDSAIEFLNTILTDKHIKKLNKKTEKDDIDYIMSMHNTPLGNIIIALIYLSLRIARLQDKKQKSDGKWNKQLKSSFEKTFEHNILEAYTVLGQYLPNIMYLDAKWTKEKIKEIEGIKNITLRRAFMVGYLNNRRVYDDIYRLESIQNHYKWAIESTWDSHISEQLVSHIAIGYLRGYEDLFNLLLKKWNPSQILDLINFFWRESEYLLRPDRKNRDDNIKRIISFWEKVFDKYKEKENDFSDDDKKILSNIVKLTIYLNQIDKKEFDWLMLSAPYIHIDDNERWLLEYLDNLKDKGEDKIVIIEYILNIILEMLKNYVFPFAQDYMKSIIEYAYELAQKENNEEIKSLANQICNILGAAGYDYLREIYEKNNKQ